MKKKLGSFVVVSLISFVSVPVVADSIAPGSGSQDQFSAGLAEKGLKRKTAAMCLLKNMVGSAGKGLLALSSKDPITKWNKVKAYDSVIPAALYTKAKCVVVIPGDKSVGISGYGLNYGAGISRCRDSQGNFGEPQFVKMEGGSYGPQIGAKSTDRVLLFMNANADKILQKPSLKLGADVSAAAGPVGRELEAGTNLHLQDGVLGYSHSEGLYAGISLDGAVLQPDTKMTAAVKGETVKRNFFEKAAHDIGGLFHHQSKEKEQAEQAKLDSCELIVALADDASGVNGLINQAASEGDGAPVNFGDSQKQVQSAAAPAAPLEQNTPAGKL